MADIRRDVGGVSPNTFIKSGVRDDSLATLVTGVGEGAMAADGALAKGRYDKAQAMLHAQYVVGSPAAGALVEDSPSDATKMLSPENDRSLRDFKDVLDTHSGARDQGKMNFASYQLRSERLLRIAIAKRPGLASEFRNIASSYVGTDVTGAEARFLADAEQAAAKAAAELADSDDKKKWKLYDDTNEEFKSVGMSGYIMFDGPDDPAWRAWKAENAPVMMQRKAAQQRLAMAEDVNKYRETEKAYNADENTSIWIAKAEVDMGNAMGLGDTIRTSLKMNKQEGNAAAVRAAFEQASQGIREAQAQREADAVSMGVPDSVVSLYRQRADDVLKRVQSVAQGTDDKTTLETYNEVLIANTRATQMSQEEYRAISVLMKDLPESVQNALMLKMEKSLLLTVASMLQDTSAPELVGKQAADILPQLILSVLPSGSSTPSDPIAVQRLYQITNQAVGSFITMPDSEFRYADFAVHPQNGKAGTLKVLDNNSTTLTKTLSPAQKQELTTTIAAAAGNGLRILKLGMNTKYKNLASKVTIDTRFPDGNAFRLKDGVKEDALSKEEKSVLKGYNRAANGTLILKVIQTYGGLPNSDAAGQMVQDAYEPGQALRASQTPKKARPAPSTGGSGGETLRGPVERWW